MHAAWIIVASCKLTMEVETRLPLKQFSDMFQTEAAYDITAAVINIAFFCKQNDDRKKQYTLSQTWKSHTITKFNYLRPPN